MTQRSKTSLKNKIVSKYRWLLSLVLGLGVSWTIAKPGLTQALLPYTPEVKADQFEEKGIDLAQQVEYLLRYRLDDEASIASAVSMARLSTQLAPNKSETWRILGILYAQQKQFDQSLIALNKAVSLDSTNPVNYFILGRIYFQKGDYPKAETNIEQGLKIKPDEVEPLFDLGNTKLKLGQLPASITAYQKAVTLDKKFWPALNNIGLVRYEQGNIEGAIKAWQEVIKIDNKQAEPQLALAVALYHQGKTEQAYKRAQEALTIDNQYANLDFLKENLWGERILEDTKTLLNTSNMQNVIKSLKKTTKTTTSSP